MDLYKHERTKYDIPVDHLDYRYVEECKDVKELEKILKVLRSGTEGTFPDLEATTEERIRKLNPKSRILIKDQPIFSTKELGAEGKALASDLEQWTNDMQNVDSSIKSALGAGDSLPPVRGSANITIGQQGANTKIKEQSKKKPMPKSHKEWDKVDIDAELRKLDEDEAKKNTGDVKNVLRNPSRPSIPDKIDATGLTDDEKRYRAEKEKEKGNEAFRAGDYDEALLYYTRSISLVASVASINNRAQTYVKLEKWDEAIQDCETVLQHEPKNLKAHLRRSVAYKNKKLYKEAKKDLDLILQTEPNNKRAKDLLKEVEEALAEQKVKGRRMVIEEVSEDEESDEETDETKNNETDQQSDNAAKTSEQIKEDKSAKSKTKITEMPESSTESEVMADKNVESNQQTAERATENTEKMYEKPDPKTGEIEVQEAKETEKTETKEAAATPPPPPPLSPELNKIKEDGNQLFRTGYYAEAIDKYNVIIDKLENDASQVMNLSVLYSNRAACKTKIGDCAGCVEDCNKSLVITPHALKPLMRRAMAYEALEKFRPAYVDYRHILAIDSSVDIALKGSARCQQTLASQDGPKWREKLPPIPTVSRSNLPPTTPRPVRQTSITTEQTKPRPEPQISKDELFENHKTEGNEHVKKGRFEKAVECYAKCIELCPDKIAAYTNRALCYLRLNKPNEVVKDCDAALQQEPGNVKALFRRGQAYKMLCQYEASQRDLELVLTLESNNTAARRELKLVDNYITEERAKKQKEEELAAKGRRKMQIQEVESSDDESEDEVTENSNDVSESDRKSALESKQKDKIISDTKIPETQAKPDIQENEKQKSEQNRSTKKGTQGMGVNYEMKTPKASSKIKQTAELSKSDIKATPYEFMSAWTALKNTEEVDPYLHILQQVQPQQLPSVISNKLEGDMLQKIVKCAHRITDAGDANKAFEYMKYLTKVPRFQMNTMFMSQQEKQEIKDVLKKFSKDIAEKDVSALAKQYGV